MTVAYPHGARPVHTFAYCGACNCIREWGCRYASTSFDRTPVERLELSKTYKGHANSVSAVAWHPTKSIVATASDDATWKLWTVPDGELVMAGEGHKEWLSGVDFHPQVQACVYLWGNVM